MNTKYTLLVMLSLTLVALPLSAGTAAPPTWEGDPITHNADAWKDVNVIAFTFKHHTGKTRRHEWWVKKHIVRVTVDGKTTEIPVNGADLQGEDEVAAHKHFVNDSFWLLFELHLRWDKPQVEDLPNRVSPFGARAHAFRVTYPNSGGYTPGDAYVAFLGQDGAVMGWSYYPGGATEPKLTTTRGGHHQFGPLTLPTRFETPEGKVYLEFTDISVR